MLLQAETALKMAGSVLETSKEQGFVIYMMVALLIFFAGLFIAIGLMYIQKQNKIVEILEKQADTRNLIEKLAESKLREISHKPDVDIHDLKKMMKDFILESQQAASKLEKLP